MRANQRKFNIRENAIEALLIFYNPEFTYPKVYIELVKKQYPEVKKLLETVNLKNFDNQFLYSKELVPSMNEYYKKLVMLEGKANYVSSWYNYNSTQFLKYLANFKELFEQFELKEDNVWEDVLDSAENSNFDRAKALKTLGINEDWVRFFEIQNPEQQENVNKNKSSKIKNSTYPSNEKQ